MPKSSRPRDFARVAECLRMGRTHRSEGRDSRCHRTGTFGFRIPNIWGRSHRNETQRPCRYIAVCLVCAYYRRPTHQLGQYRLVWASPAYLIIDWGRYPIAKRVLGHPFCRSDWYFVLRLPAINQLGGSSYTSRSASVLKRGQGQIAGADVSACPKPPDRIRVLQDYCPRTAH